MGQGQSVSRGQTAEEKNGEILYSGPDTPGFRKDVTPLVSTPGGLRT